MNIGLILVGLLSTVIGIVLIVNQAGGKVKAKTQFGDFSGSVGPVALIFGLVLQGIGFLL